MSIVEKMRFLCIWTVEKMGTPENSLLLSWCCDNWTFSFFFSSGPVSTLRDTWCLGAPLSDRRGSDRTSTVRVQSQRSGNWTLPFFLSLTGINPTWHLKPPCSPVWMVKIALHGSVTSVSHPAIRPLSFFFLKRWVLSTFTDTWCFTASPSWWWRSPLKSWHHLFENDAHFFSFFSFFFSSIPFFPLSSYF